MAHIVKLKGKAKLSSYSLRMYPIGMYAYVMNFMTFLENQKNHL